MKIHTFHTYSDLVVFYQDFEKILEYYENLRYFLHYKNCLDISDRKIIEKVMELEEISAEFQEKLGILYKMLYKTVGEDFLISVENYIKSQGVYTYTMKKFIEDIRFYQKCDEDFFVRKHQIEREIQSLILLQEQNYGLYLEGNLTREDFTEKSLVYYIALVALRTDLLGYSSFQSVIEQSLEDMSMNSKIVQEMLKVLNLYEHVLFVKPTSYNVINFSHFDGISFIKKILQEKYPYAFFVFSQALLRGDIDFLPNTHKVPYSFTSINKGKRPKILLNFQGKYADIVSLIHEFGHAFQMEQSKNITLLEMLPSPFMSEFSASIFEKILQDYCDKYNEYGEFSRFIKQEKKSILAKAYQSSIFEIAIYNSYQAGKFSDIKTFKKWFHKEGFNYEQLASFFLNSHIFSSPLYFTAYLFALVFSEILYHENDFSIFESIIIQGGTKSVQDIFSSAGININDMNVYQKGVEKIFS